VKVAQALELILTELRKAEEKHPGWPTDPCRRMMIIAEESGEAVQAVLSLVELEEQQHRDIERFGRSQLDYLALRIQEGKTVHEVAQTGAMALRWLINYRSKFGEPQRQQSGVATDTEQRS